MATGAMTGADVSALRSLATGMSQSAEQLAHLRTRLQGLLGSVHWTGVDAARFRQQWDGQLRSLLHNVEQDLRSVGTQLKTEADQQENASRDDGSGAGGRGFIGGAGGGGGGGGWSDWLIPALGGATFLHKGLDFTHSAGEKLLTGVKEHYIKQVNGPLRQYERYAAGHATQMKKYFGTTKDVERDLKFLKKAGPVLQVAGAGLDFVDQYRKDGSGHYSEGERISRATGAAGSNAVVGVLSGAAVEEAAAAGFVVGGPVGAVVGGGVVLVGTTVLSSHYGEQISEVGAEAGSLAWKGGSAVVDFGGHALHEGGDLLSSGAHSAAHAVSSGASSAAHHVGHAVSSAWSWAT